MEHAFVPLWLKLAYGVSLPVIAVVYWRAYGPGNFLWLSDIALLCTALALSAHVPLFDALLRGLAGGVAAYVVTWALALAVARQLVIAEIRARHAEAKAAHDAAVAAISGISDGS